MTKTPLLLLSLLACNNGKITAGDSNYDVSESENNLPVEADEDEEFKRRCAMIAKRAGYCGLCQALFRDLTSHKSRRPNCKTHTGNKKATKD